MCRWGEGREVANFLCIVYAPGPLAATGGTRKMLLQYLHAHIVGIDCRTMYYRRVYTASVRTHYATNGGCCRRVVERRGRRDNLEFISRKHVWHMSRE